MGIEEDTLFTMSLKEQAQHKEKHTAKSGSTPTGTPATARTDQHRPDRAPHSCQKDSTVPIRAPKPTKQK